MSGWIKLHRRIVDSDIYQMPPLYLRTFERLILEANYEDREIPYREKGSKVTGKKLIRRGERLTSVRDICKWVAWYERGKLVIPNPRTIQNILDWLEENNMIEIYGEKGNRKETHYKIVNYNDYQKKDDEEVTEEQQQNNNETTVSAEKQEYIKNYKNYKNDKEEYKLESQQSCNDDEPSNADLGFDENSTEIQLARFMISEMLRVKPDSKVPKDDVKSLQNWAKQIDYMIRLDKRESRQIAELFRWAQNDTFWCANIRSPKKLRDKWDTLELQRNRGKPKANNNLSKLEEMYHKAKAEEAGD